MKKKDTHIEILRCSHNHPKGITISEIEKKLMLPAGSLKWVDDECNTGGMKFWRTARADNGQWILTLSMEGRAILLKHDELAQARKSSRTATWIAIGALFVSILVGLGQFLIPTELNQTQLNKILQSENDLHLIIKKMDTIESRLTNQDSIILRKEK